MEKVSFFFLFKQAEETQGEHGGMGIEHMERITKRKKEKEKDLILS